MNPKKIAQNFIYIICGSILAIFISYVAHAASYNAPSGSAPNGNTPFPINVGTTNQVKQGGLSVLAFNAYQNAELDGNSYFTGTWHADANSTTSPNTINFGGTDPKNVIRKVSLAITGGFGNTGSIASSPLANNVLTPVCSDTTGAVILCTAVDICSNISGTQTTIPSGYVANSDGTCSLSQKHFSSIIADGDHSVEYFSNNVVNSALTFHVPTKAYIPLVAILSLDDDFPYGWIVDDFGTEVRSTSFGPQNIATLNQADSYSTLYAPTEAGTYNFKISSQGQVGIKGKFDADANVIGVDFYMRIHSNSTGADQWIHLDQNTAKFPEGALTHEAYPVTGKSYFDFGTETLDNSNIALLSPQTGGKNYLYVPYNFTFQQTITLNQGDAVNLYAFVYGRSATGGGNVLDSLGNTIGHSPLHNSPNNFTYSFSSPYQGTSIDFLKTS